MKKTISLFLVLAMLLATLSACGDGGSATSNPPAGGNTDTPASSAPTDPPSGDPVELTISIWGDEARAAAFTESLADFCAANNCTVNINTCAVADYYDKLSTQLGAGTASDVFWVADSKEGTYISGGWCANLRDILEEDAAWDIGDFYENVLERTDYIGDGGIYGVPFSFGVRAIFWNKTLFEAAGVKTPAECVADGTWTYETMFDLGSQINAYDSTKIGVRLWPVGNIGNAINDFADIWRAYGTDIVNSNSTEFTLDSEGGIKSTQLVYDAMFKQNAHAKPGDDTAFLSGNVAMARDVFSYMRNIAEGSVDFEWDIVPQPYGDAGKDGPLYTGYAYWCANANGDHVELASKLIRYITSSEKQLEWCGTFLTPRASVMTSDTLLNRGEGYPSPESIKAAFVDSVDERGLTGYTASADWTLFQTTAEQYHELIWAGSYSVEDGIAALKEASQQYLNR